jgi:hypothetical protein
LLIPDITTVETPVSPGTLVATTQAKEGTVVMPETAGLLATAGTEGTPFNSRNAGYKYQQQQGCQQQFMDASNSRADCKSFENRSSKDTCTTTSGQPAAADTSNEKKGQKECKQQQGRQQQLAGKQQKRPPQLMGFSENA